MSMKILLTGASGFLGWNFCRQFANKYEIHGTCFRHKPNDCPKVKWHKINLIDTKAVKVLVNSIQPDFVIHLAAIANVAFCEEHPALSYHVNVYTTVALAEACKALGVPLIFTSTDLVFNGGDAPYSEEDWTYPLSQYGQQKVAAEDILLNDFDESLIVRIPLQFGFTPAYSQNFFTTALENLRKGETINAFVDEFRTPLSGIVTSYFLERIINKWTESVKLRLLHVAGKERVSRYELMRKAAEYWELNIELINKVEKEKLQIAPRPTDVSLSVSAFEKLMDNERIPSIKKMLTLEGNME